MASRTHLGAKGPRYAWMVHDLVQEDTQPLGRRYLPAVGLPAHHHLGEVQIVDGAGPNVIVLVPSEPFQRIPRRVDVHRSPVPDRSNLVAGQLAKPIRSRGRVTRLAHTQIAELALSSRPDRPLPHKSIFANDHAVVIAHAAAGALVFTVTGDAP